MKGNDITAHMMEEEDLKCTTSSQGDGDNTSSNKNDTNTNIME